MACISSFLLIVFFLFSILPFISQSKTLKSEKQAFKFLQNLKEVHKGQTVVGLDEVKKFLIRFGYYPKHYHVDHLNSDFDDQLESALRKYQKFYRLRVTGILDSDTITKMGSPRCGVPDFTNFTSLEPSSANIGTHYVFPVGTPRWNKFNLTYSFLPNVPNSQDVKAAFREAFVTWQIVSQFNFHEAAAGEIQDLLIGFYSGAHGDRQPFDGPGNVWAHAFFPKDGRSHYDASENWSTHPSSNQVDVESVAVHEIGHLLGLAHSQDPKAVMYATFEQGTIKRDLSPDDVQGIQTLYPLKH